MQMQMYAHANKCKCNEHSHAEICTLRCTITCKWIWICTFALYTVQGHHAQERRPRGKSENQVSPARCPTLPLWRLITKYTTHRHNVSRRLSCGRFVLARLKNRRYLRLFCTKKWTKKYKKMYRKMPPSLTRFFLGRFPLCRNLNMCKNLHL